MKHLSSIVSEEWFFANPKIRKSRAKASDHSLISSAEITLKQELVVHLDCGHSTLKSLTGRRIDGKVRCHYCEYPGLDNSEAWWIARRPPTFAAELFALMQKTAGLEEAPRK